MIPIFITHLLNQTSPTIFGDGTTSRDFTYIDNVVYANVLAMISNSKKGVYNVAYGASTSLNQLFDIIKIQLQSEVTPIFKAERKGDIKNSLANIDEAKKHLNYNPLVDIKTGLIKTIDWYKTYLKQ